MALELTCYGIILRAAPATGQAEAIPQAIATIAPDLGFDLLGDDSAPLMPGDAIASHPLVVSLDRAMPTRPEAGREGVDPESVSEEEGPGP